MQTQINMLENWKIPIKLKYKSYSNWNFSVSKHVNLDMKALLIS